MLSLLTQSSQLLSKDFRYFSYIYRINSKTQLRLRPNSTKIALFSIKTTKNFYYYNTKQSNFPYSTSYFFSTKFRTIFFFIEFFLQMTDQIHVLPLNKILQIVLLLFPLETSATLKFTLQTENLNIIKYMTLTLWCTMLHMNIILSLQNP